MHALHMTSQDLQLITNQFDKKLPKKMTEGGEEDIPPDHDLQRLSLYHRVSRLAEIMDLSIQDLLHLLDLLEKDPGIRSYTGFQSLIHYPIQNLNTYQILAKGSIQESLWLVQMLLALSQWMQVTNFSAAELKTILTGEVSDKEKLATEQRRINSFNTLYEAFKPLLFSNQYYISETVDTRTARVIYDTLIKPRYALVASQDQRILTATENKTKPAIYQALSRLRTITAEDFKGLGITQKMQDKLVSILFLKGVIKTDGELVDDPLETLDNMSHLCGYFNNEAVYELIVNNLQDYLGTEQPLEEFALFPNDLDALELDKNTQKLLYDNLIFNGYLDNQGTVLNPQLFVDDNHQSNFQANTYIHNYKTQIRELIAAKINDFEISNCNIDKALFEALPLKDIERADLVENLRFNDYLDADNNIIDKSLVITLKLADFELALTYYPYRKSILDILKYQILNSRSKHLTLTADDFSELANTMVAEDIYSQLQGHFLESDSQGEKQATHFNEHALTFFDDEENASSLFINNPNLNHYFDANSTLIVFKAIARMIQTAEQYKLTSENFSDLALEADEISELFDALITNQYIQEDGALTADQVQYFLTINNALDFDIENSIGSFEDFNKDIFFSIHALAKVINNTSQNLIKPFLALAQQQEDTLFANLQELLEIPVELVQVICQHVLASNEHPVEQFMVPILAAVTSDNRIIQHPGSKVFNIAFNRIQQFAQLAVKLDLNAVESDVIFRDQNLVDKFSEKLTLPSGLERIDCLIRLHIDTAQFPKLSQIESSRDVLFLYDTESQQYWLYDSHDYQQLTSSNNLELLSPLLKDATIAAAFNDKDSNAWFISGNTFYYQKADETQWEKREKELGKVNSNFTNAQHVDVAFNDPEGSLYFFAGDQYVRSANNLLTIDEGYPKRIKDNWQQEHGLALPDNYNKAIDATFINTDDKQYFFKDQHFVSSDNPDQELVINEVWGKVKNNFAASTTPLHKLDAAFVHDNKVYFFAGDQCITWSNSLEHNDGYADSGSLQSLNSLIADLPDVFEDRIDAIFHGVDNKIYVFKDGYSLTCNQNFEIEEENNNLAKDWGKVSNRITHTGQVDAAFAGLDGKIYLFSGTQFFRYSGSNYTYVDTGYPKTIVNHWGGLKTVDAAFILDGKTYLMGKNTSNKATYVRYSENDYSLLDEDYPRPLLGNWWTDHFNLDEEDHTEDFTTPDTVFIGKNNVTYLFRNDEYIAYDNLHRWWSEPKKINSKWVGFEFDRVDAAFTGKDGNTYLFAKTKHFRYSDKHFSKLDKRYPKTTRSSWGVVNNNIQQDKQIDAALSIPASDTHPHQTYLFSGNQFVRYSDGDYNSVDEGYPRPLSQLSEEARFSQLETSFTHIDAAFADKRNVYLFKDEQCNIVADSIYKHYQNHFDRKPKSVVQDGHKLFVYSEAQNQEGWFQITNLENQALLIPATLSPLNAQIPEGISNVDAAFVGTDQSTYVFKNGECYNDILEKSYPINEEWGRARNPITENNHIDAAFTGNDGATYLFSGDQYFAYHLDPGTPENSKLLVGYPKLIAEDWGLNNVHIAFIRDGKTYLLEATDEDGNFRYQCYTDVKSFTNRQADSEPQTVNNSWWEFPSIYIEEGFDRVDAVLLENEHLYLIKDEQFIQYNQEEDIWTYPRPLERIWRNIPFTAETGKAIATAFTDSKDQHWFFSDNHYSIQLGNNFSAPIKINEQWGKINNNIVQNNHIDAALVLDEKTYLFSGEQYVRYSSADYRYIDAGYPKLIVGDLRTEDNFNHLPDAFETQMTALFAEQKSICSIVADERNIFIFATQDCYVVSRKAQGQFPISRLGHIKNNLQTLNKVDAAFVNSKDQTFLFSGDQYMRYSRKFDGAVDEGYPKPIAGHFGTEVDGVAVNTSGGIDAIVLTQKDNVQQTLVFKGMHVYSSTRDDNRDDDWVISDIIQPAENRFATKAQTEEDEQETSSIATAALVSPTGDAYFFKDGYYIRYSDIGNEYVDEGFPKAIKDNWGHLPNAFEEDIEHAFVFEGKTYLVNDHDYVRYSSTNYQQMDALYPQKFTYRWGSSHANQWCDYLLSDIKIISDFKTLLENNLSNQYSLSDLLNLQRGYQKEPYKILSEIFGWDTNEVKWLKRKNAFLQQREHAIDEINFNIELVLKIHAIFSVAETLGTSPKILYENIYLIDKSSKKTEEAADHLYQLLRLNNNEKNWEIITRELHDKLNQLKHDALLPYVISEVNGVENARDLFAEMLIDVNMGTDAKTSTIKEAISALQLYVHRYFVNLETSTLKNTEHESLKNWWQWMRNYRVWEANRKVFLYPENYIRPELRNTKTPAFKKLEEALLQGEVTQELVTTAFHNYLGEFALVGNLKITGANVYTDPNYEDDDSLVLFGHTRTEPAQYYYRTARFVKRDTPDADTNNSTDEDTEESQLAKQDIVLWDNWLKAISNVSTNTFKACPMLSMQAWMLLYCIMAS